MMRKYKVLIDDDYIGDIEGEKKTEIEEKAIDLITEKRPAETKEQAFEQGLLMCIEDKKTGEVII